MASIHTYPGRNGPRYRVFWRTPDGRQRTRSFQSRAEARSWRATVDQLEVVGQAPDPSRGELTVAELAAQIVPILPLKPKTAETYASLLRSRILPTFGPRSVGSITRQDVRSWVAGMSGELSPRRIQNAHALLRRLLNEAVLEGRIATNPASGVALPRQPAVDVRPWTVDELTAVAACAGHYEPLVLWLGLMGSRWAETIGLGWQDLNDGVVTISSSLSEVNGKFHRVSTKTNAARTLPIPAALLERLGQPGDGLVFRTSRGNPIRSAAFRHRVFLPACESAGIRPIRIHHLRHTCASILIQRGANPKAVQQWLGHRDIRVTLETYSHLYPRDLDDLSRQVDLLLSTGG